MRKMIALALVSLLLICGTASAETSIDLSTMSLDELVELHKLLDAEIDARIGVEPSMIAGGVYTAGETIKAGAYVITCTAAYAEEGMAIQVYASHAQYDECRSVLNQYKDDYQLFAGHILPGQSVTVSLSDGMVLVIDGGVGLAEAIAPAWAP